LTRVKSTESFVTFRHRTLNPDSGSMKRRETEHGSIRPRRMSASRSCAIQHRAEIFVSELSEFQRFSSSRLSAQRACPSGGVEQANSRLLRRRFQSPHLRMNQTFTTCVRIAYVSSMAVTNGQ
jgi:hypothetical protein